MDFQQIIIAAIFVFVVVFILMLLWFYFLFVKKTPAPAWKKQLEKKYRTLLTKNMDKKLILIELDKLLEFALKSRFGEKEKSLGALLKEYKGKFTKDALDDIWFAHKLRNKLVHDVDYDPAPSDLNRSVILLKKAIINLFSY